MKREQTAFLLRRVRRIRGWFWPAAGYLFALLDELQKQAGIRGNLFEIGTFHGKSAVFLAGLLDAEGERLGVCDTFGDLEKDATQHNSGFYPTFAQNFRRTWPDHPFLHVHGGSSRALTAAETTNNCRLFHIDGGHEGPDVYHDLLLADQAVGDSGVVVLDDMYNFAWPGVAEGYFRFMAERPGRFVPLVIGFNKGVLTRPDAYGLYSACFENDDRCWQYMPRGPYTLKRTRFCDIHTFIFHLPSYRSPDLLRPVLAEAYRHRPELTDRLARLVNYHGRQPRLQPAVT